MIFLSPETGSRTFHNTSSRVSDKPTLKMDITFILIFFVVFLISAVLLSKPKRLPPGPVSLPVLGPVSLIREFVTGIKRPHIVLYEAAKKYGNIMSFKLGCERIVVLSGYDTIHEALVKQSDVFSDRPPLAITKMFTKDGGGIIFERYNHHWKTMRRFTLQTLRDFGVGKSSIEEKIIIEINAATKELHDTRNEPIVIAPLLQKIIGNVIYGIVFGQRYDYDDQEFEMVRSLSNMTVSGQGAVSPINFFPAWIVKLLLRQRYKEDAQLAESPDGTGKFMLEKIKEHEDTYDDNNIRDFVDLYIQSSRENKDETKETFTKGNMLRVIQDLFIAGSETTSTTLDWALLFMIEHPDVQQKCQQEIEEILGDKPIEYADRGKLPYVDATIMETQRLANIVPLSVPHMTMKDTVIQGYKIPQGSVVLPNLYSVSHDPNYWTEPETFNPERYFDKARKIVKNDALVPFSVGPRVCLGEPLARMELFLVFANLLQRFTFQRENDNVKHSMESKINQVTNAPLEYKLKAYAR